MSDYLEDESLIRLDKEQLSLLDKSIEYFISKPDDSKAIWILTDNLIELSDKVKNIQSGYYENFPQLIKKSKSLLEYAKIICTDKTIGALIEDAINEIDKCLERLGISKEEPKEPEYEKYKPEKHSYPSKYGYKFPFKEPVNRKEELAQDLARDITYLNKEALPDKWKLDLYANEPNPEEDRLWLSIFDKIKQDQEEYKHKKAELTELSKQKYELKSQAENLAQFRSKLLSKVIDNIIAQGKE
jgi:hypothetical protein